MSKKYKIVKGAEIPARHHSHQPKFPFSQMEIGDSFFVPQTDIREAAARVQCSKWSRKLGRRFRVRRFDQIDAQFWRES